MANTTEAAAETAGHAADAAHSAGMPQLDPTSFPSQIFWLLVTLVVIYTLLAKFALPRIGGVIQTRKGTIDGDLSAAQDLKKQAKDAERAYEDALTKARSEAQKIVAENKASIQKDLDAALAKADAEIKVQADAAAARLDAIRAGAADAVSEVARDTAAEIVGALGGGADAKTVAAAVTARLKG